MDTHSSQHQHGQQTYASRRTNEDWESWRPLIQSWHNEGLSRQQMCGLLFEQGFTINHSQLRRRMSKWKMLVRSTSLQSCVSSDSDGTTVAPVNNLISTDNCIVANDQEDHNWCEKRLAKPATCSTIDQRPQSSMVGCTLPAAIAINALPTTKRAASLSSNLKGTAARARVSQKMGAIEIGLPETTCCCDEFFKAINFKRWEPLYNMLLDESEPQKSLHFARSMALLCRGSVLSDAMVLRLQSTLHYYEGMLARPKMRNDAAYAIALQLADILDHMPGQRNEFGTRMAVELGIDDPYSFSSESKRVRDTYSYLYHGVHCLSILALKPSDDPKDWDDYRTEQRRCMDERLSQQSRADWLRRTIQDCRDIILDSQNLITIAEYASLLKPWAYLEGHIHARAQIERTNTISLAQRISETLISNAHQIAWPDDWFHGAQLTSLVFDAISLIVAQEFHESGRLRGLPNDDISIRLSNATRALEIMGTPSLSGGTTHINQKLLRTIWMCDPQRPLFAPQGLHLGPCRAKKCWELLGQSVKQFDQSTCLVAPTALPSRYERQPPDTMSLFNSPTKSSFRAFRRLSDKLKQQGSTLTGASILSKWPSHMSLDSSTPANMLGTGSDVHDRTSQLQEHRKLDQEAHSVWYGVKV